MGGTILKTGKVITKTAEKMTINANNGDIIFNAAKSVKYSAKKDVIYDSYVAPEAEQTEDLLVTKVECTNCGNDNTVEVGKTYTFKAVQFSRKPKAGGKELENIKWAYQIDDGEIQEFNNKGKVVGNTVVKKITIAENNYDNNKITIYAYTENSSDRVSIVCQLITAYLKFDGRFLLFRVKLANEIKRFTYKAISGRGENGSFDYSVERQKIVSTGPLPEGEYHINPNAVQLTANRGAIDELKGAVGRGTFPGGDYSWGYGRVWIKPDPVVVDGVTRGGFTIHGGDDPGSAGCIDLVGNDEAFFSALKEYGTRYNKIFLKVDYSSVRETPVKY